MSKYLSAEETRCECTDCPTGCYCARLQQWYEDVRNGVKSTKVENYLGTSCRTLCKHFINKEKTE
jgi:hypothetical protein